MEIINIINMSDLARHECPSSSVVRTADSGVRKVMGSIPVGELDCFFFPHA